jgi:hypothetical protein
MPSKQNRDKRKKAEHAFIAIRVDGYDVSAEASISHQVAQPQYAFGDLTDDEPVYKYVTHLKITGTATHPEERAGERYELTVYGDDSPSRNVHLALRDVQVRNDYNSPQYRDYRGRRIPIVNPIPGFTILTRDRGDGTWMSSINLAPRLVSDMLALLGTGRTVYLALHECKERRARWIRRFGLQTIDPAEE